MQTPRNSPKQRPSQPLSPLPVSQRVGVGEKSPVKRFGEVHMLDKSQTDVRMRFESLCDTIKRVRNRDVSEEFAISHIRSIRNKNDQNGYKYSDLLALLELSNKACSIFLRIQILGMAMDKIEDGQVPTYQEVLEFVKAARSMITVSNTPKTDAELEADLAILMDLLSQLRGHDSEYSSPKKRILSPRQPLRRQAPVETEESIQSKLDAAEERRKKLVDAKRREKLEREQQLAQKKEEQRKEEIGHRNFFVSPVKQAKPKKAVRPEDRKIKGGLSLAVQLVPESPEKKDTVGTLSLHMSPSQLRRDVEVSTKELSDSYEAEVLKRLQEIARSEYEKSMVESVEAEQIEITEESIEFSIPVISELEEDLMEITENEVMKKRREAFESLDPEQKTRVIELAKLFEDWPSSYAASIGVWDEMKQNKEFSVDALLYHLDIGFGNFLTEALRTFSAESIN